MILVNQIVGFFDQDIIKKFRNFDFWWGYRDPGVKKNLD